MGAHSCPHTPTCSHAYAHSHPHVPTCMPTRIHTCPPVCPCTHPRTPRHTLMHTHACLHVRSRMPMTRPHTLVGSHATARALRIRTQAHRQPPRVHVCAHVRLAPTLCAHESRPYAYARMGWLQAHYAPSRNVVRGVTPMRRRGYALCVHGRNTMRDVTQLGVNGCKRVRLGTTWADASVCVWASGGVENPSWACMGAFGHTWTHTWVHTWVHEGQKFHFWDK